MHEFIKVSKINEKPNQYISGLENTIQMNNQQISYVIMEKLFHQMLGKSV